MTFLLTALIGLMIVAAAIALEIRQRLSAIVALGGLGFLLAVAFLLLGAPDVAITQIAVEVLSLLLLLRVTAGAPQSDDETEDRKPVGVGAMVASVSAALFVAAAGVVAFSEYPVVGEPVVTRVADAPSLLYLEQGLADTGAANIVTAILLDFRAYDTLGEATVLFCAVLGALVVLQKRRRTATGEEDTR